MRAKDFIRASYPNLPAASIVQVVQSAGLTGVFRFRLFRMYVNETGNDIDPAQYKDILLATDFTFDATGRIERYFASGRLVRDGENKAFAQEVGRHVNWSDETIAAELAARGARFGPSNGGALLSSLAIRSLEPMIGELTLVESMFRIPRDSERKRGEPLGEGSIGWRFDFQSGTGLRVYIDVEPFGGAITFVEASRRD